MGNVMVIPARRQVGNTVKNRNSLSSALQPTAESARILMNRKQAMTHRSPTTQKYIQKNPEWELAGIFAD